MKELEVLLDTGYQTDTTLAPELASLSRTGPAWRQSPEQTHSGCSQVLGTLDYNIIIG